MSEDKNLLQDRKHRVIHWSTGGAVEETKRPWTVVRVAAWGFGGLFAILLAAGITIRAVKWMVGPETFAQWTGADGAAVLADDPSSAFINQSKAEMVHETVGKALAEIRRLPHDHPVQLQRLILIEKAFIAGEELLAQRNYAKAHAHFTAVGREIEGFADSARLKQEVQQAYDRVLVRIRELDAARDLSPELLDQALEAAGIGRQLLIEGNFGSAKSQFDNAFARLDAAAKILADYITENQLKGQEALGNGDAAAAAEAFRTVLEKLPGDETAVRGLQRSAKIKDVHALLLEAKAHEEAQRYDQAADAYGRAFAIDAYSAAAQQGQARAVRLARETKFNAAVSLARDAVERRQWAAAITAYEEALKVEPGNAEIRKTLADTREKAHREAVKDSLAKGLEFEDQNRWQEAREAYYATLQLEPENQDAKEGYGRAGKVIRALVQFNKLIEVAQEFEAKAQFQSAISVFNEAMSAKPAFLDLSQEIVDLRTRLASQNTPENITFQSDGRTWVSITNYRMLGRITSETVRMLPGNYEIVGRRKGYQDVLLLLQVRNGSPPPVVEVIAKVRKAR